MNTIWLVEYRWNWEHDNVWNFMFIAESLEAVRQRIPEYCIYPMSSDWSKFWTQHIYIYARRTWKKDYQTIRIQQVDIVPERRIEKLAV